MNPFYQKLVVFGQLIQRASNCTHTEYQEFFEVEHPAQPVIKFSKNVRPKIHFSKHCPPQVRGEIKDLFSAAFNG
jgi:hypothetical protein